MKLNDYGLKPLNFAEPAAESLPDTLPRRGFMMTVLASGFAMAANPVLAQAIHTDMEGLTAGPVSIPVADGKIPGYRAMPAKPGKYPVMLVIQEIFGVHEHIQDICRRFAKIGYYAIAPELFARQGDVSRMTDVGSILSAVVSKVPDAQLTADIDAAVTFAGASGQGNIERVGLIGFCWGGRAAWVYAHHNPKLKAAVAYYGLLDGMKSDIRLQDPVDFASEISVPVLGIYAGNDKFIKTETIDKMQAGIAQSGSGSEIIVFPNVNHGFNADYRPTYDKLTAQYAWKLALDWFKERGV